jgi:hypothetical protein
MEDSLKLLETENGLEIQWDPEDPKWSFLNYMTEEEVNQLLQEALENSLNKNEEFIPNYHD